MLLERAPNLRSVQESSCIVNSLSILPRFSGVPSIAMSVAETIAKATGNDARARLVLFCDHRLRRGCRLLSAGSGARCRCRDKFRIRLAPWLLPSTPGVATAEERQRVRSQFRCVEVDELAVAPHPAGDLIVDSVIRARGPVRNSEVTGVPATVARKSAWPWPAEKSFPRTD